MLVSERPVIFAPTAPRITSVEAIDLLDKAKMDGKFVPRNSTILPHNVAADRAATAFHSVVFVTT